jgi:hypothetical protein
MPFSVRGNATCVLAIRADTRNESTPFLLAIELF